MRPKTKFWLNFLGILAAIALLAVAAFWIYYFMLFGEGHPGGAPRG